jgi:hypothetical protein
MHHIYVSTLQVVVKRPSLENIKTFRADYKDFVGRI